MSLRRHNKEIIQFVHHLNFYLNHSVLDWKYMCFTPINYLGHTQTRAMQLITQSSTSF